MFQLTKRRRNISLLIAFIFIVFSIQSLGDSKSVVKAQITTYQFDFGSGTVKEDYIQVKSDTEYSSDLGYGWESISGVQERIRESNDQLKNDFCFSNQKMSFKINLPAGTYSVRTIIGDSKAAQVKMNVSAEDVLKLDRVSTLKANQFIEEEFIVDVRDNQLNLSFEGMEGDYTARINALEITKLNSLEVVNPYPKPDSDDFPVYTDLGVTVGEEELNLYTSDWRNVGQFEYSGTPTVIVTSPVKIQSVTIRPSVYGIEYQVNEKVCTFTMPEFNSLQSKVEVKVTGTDGLVRTVDILGDSIEIDRPTESSEDVYYFGSGVSTPGTNGVWTLENVNNKIIYIDRGAVLQARVNIKNSNNITVRGRGMFRDSRSNKESVSSTFGFYNVSHLIFEDIILGKARNHQIFLTNVKDATIKNIKQASSTGNTDGITINSGCEDILVDNSYLMVNDDTIVINSDSVNEEDMNNIVFQNIVMGNDNNGYKLSFRGYSYGVVNDILFKNIYTLKTPKGYGFMKTSYKDTCGVWLKRLENLTFENVYIENSANSQIMNYTYNEPGDGIARINAMSIYSNVAKFDFGSGAVESEYTQISENTAYSSELGYGFESTSNIKVRDRGGSDNLKGDFCFSENPYIFKTDLPNGNYSVRILSGDTKATQEKMNIFAEDTLKLEDVSTSKANEFIDETFWVMVEDGQLTLRFESAESGKTIRINGIEINAVYADFDFGTGSVKEGYKQVTNETEYSAESGYGWDSTTYIQNAQTDDGNGFKDYCYSKKESEFMVDIPNGEYKVRVISGDTSVMQGKMNVYAEEEIKLEEVAASAIQSFIDETFAVTVQDGQLNVKLKGMFERSSLEQYGYITFKNLHISGKPIITAPSNATIVLDHCYYDENPITSANDMTSISGDVLYVAGEDKVPEFVPPTLTEIEAEEPPATEGITIQSIQDATITQYNEISQDLRVKYFTNNYFSDRWSRNAFVKFDLSNAQSTGVTSAKLWLHSDFYVDVNDLNNPVQIYEVTDDSWTETNLTWPGPAMGSLQSEKVVNEYGWISFDITDAVNNSLLNDRILSLGLRHKNDGAREYNEFSGREDNNVPYIELIP